MISCTRKWGDHVTIGFETDGPARLTAVCDLLCDGGQDSKSGQNIIWDGAPAGQYVFYAQVTTTHATVCFRACAHGAVHVGIHASGHVLAFDPAPGVTM